MCQLFLSRIKSNKRINQMLFLHQPSPYVSCRISHYTHQRGICPNISMITSPLITTPDLLIYIAQISAWGDIQYLGYQSRIIAVELVPPPRQSCHSQLSGMHLSSSLPSSSLVSWAGRRDHVGVEVAGTRLLLALAGTACFHFHS